MGQDTIIIRKHFLDLNNVCVDHENDMLLNFLSWHLISIKLKVNVPWGYHSCEMTVASELLITSFSLSLCPLDTRIKKLTVKYQNSLFTWFIEK